MRYRLRTLIIALTIAPPLLALGWCQWRSWQESRRQQEFDELIPLIQTTIVPRSSGN